MANNENINKVIYGNDTLIDLTSDTVTQADVLNSKSFHDASGTLRTGTADISGKADLTDLADAFSDEQAYSKGDYVTYDGDLYRFTSNKSAGAWDSTKATQITVADELSVLPSKADKIQLAPEFSTSSSYSAGSYCTFNGKLYRFDSNKSAGDWSYSKVTEVTVGSELRQKENWTSFSSGDFLVVDLAVEHQLPQHNVSLMRADSVSAGGDGVVSADQVTIALNKTANPEMIAPTFSSSQPYAKGDYVTKLDGVVGAKVKLFQFTANHTGSWTGLDVREVEVTTVLNTKVDKVSGKGLSTNDYDNTAKGIVDNIQDNVKANTQLISESIWGERGKNELENTATPSTISGVVFAVNQDKSVTVSGKNTSGDWVNKTINTLPYDAVKGKILSGVTGGSLQTYMIFARIQDSNGGYLSEVNCVDGDVIIPANVQYAVSVAFNIRVKSGYTFTNPVSVYPMLRDANILDSTYEPYHSSVKDTLRDAEVIEGKNKLNNFLVSATDRTVTAITNSDKSVTVNGTPTSTAWFRIAEFPAGSLPAGRYILSGCPSGGSNKTYKLMIREDPPTSWQRDDYGSGNAFDLTDTTKKYVSYIGVYGTASNLLFKPMLRLASETDPAYEPYYIPLKDSMFPREEQRVLGAKNLLPNKAASKTDNGVTWTVDQNGVITADGTAEGNNSTIVLTTQYLLKAGSYVLSGAKSQYEFIQIYMSSSPYTEIARDTGNGASINLTTDTLVNVIIAVSVGTTVNNSVYKPMLRLVSDPDDTYVPYAMTNRELTVKAYNTSDTAETTIADADYFPFYDTSATGKRKTLWSTIKSVLKTYFDSLYNKYLENSSVVLSTSTTTDVTFTDASITANSLIQYACTQWDIVPDDITASAGSCTVTMPKVDTAVTVGVRIYLR